MKKKEKSVRKRTFWRKFWRFWFFFSFSVLILILCTILAVRIFLPPERLKILLSDFVEQNTGRRLTLGDVRFNPLSGFELQDIELYPAESIEPSDKAFPLRSASVKRAVFSYSLRELLHRRILIRRVLLDSPIVELFLSPTQQDTNINRIASAPADSLILPNISFDVKLETAQLRNAAFHVRTATLQQKQTMTLEQVSLSLDNILIPRGDLWKSDSLMHGDARLSCQKTRFFFQQIGPEDSLSVNGELDLTAMVNVQSLSDISFDLGVEVNRLDLSLPTRTSLSVPIDLTMRGRANLKAQKIDIAPLRIEIDTERWLGITAQIEDVLLHPVLNVIIDEGRIPVEKALQLGRPFFPESFPLIYLHNRNAALSFAGTTICGVIPDSTGDGEIKVTGILDLRDFGTTLNQGEVELENLDLSSRWSLSVTTVGLQDISAKTAINFDSLSYRMSDSLDIFTGACHFDAGVHLNGTVYPDTAYLDITVKNVLGAQLEGHTKFSELRNLQEIRGQGWIRCTDFPLSRFPDLPLRSLATLTLDYRLQSLDSIEAQLDLSTTPLITTDEEPITLPALSCKVNLTGRSDVQFENIELNSLDIKINDIVTLLAQGRFFNGDQKRFAFEVTRLQIDHEPILNWLPGQTEESLDEITFSGSTVLNADLSGRLSPELEYSGGIQLVTDISEVALPGYFFSMSGINLNVTASTETQKSSQLTLNLTIDSTRTDNIRSAVFLHNTFGMRARSEDLKTFEITDGHLGLPDFKAAVDFNASIENTIKGPIIFADVHLSQEALETIKITRDILLKGITDLKVSLKVDSVLAQIDASLSTENLNFFLPNNTVVEQISGRLNLFQKYDIGNNIFLGSASPIVTPSAGVIDYLTYRPYYRYNLDRLSSLSVKRIRASGYEIENFAAELYLGDGMVEIPNFLANVYGGNWGGRMSLDLAGGDLSKAQYHISSHFAGINSAMLLPRATGEEKKGIINGNFNFEGEGLDPNQGIDVTGFFNITEIQPKVADYFLRSLDPEGLDPGIRTTRRLINAGFKPKLMAFRLQHGHFYPSIPLAQPWYFPIHISGGTIELTRLPVDFFLKRAVAVSARSAPQRK